MLSCSYVPNRSYITQSIFGTKKGTLAAYASTWYVLFSRSIQLLTNTPNLTLTPSQFALSTTYRFQHTALTSRLTVYVLAVFWCFFFFFGESLLLITFNYNTLVDLIPSSFFVFTKSHIVFQTFSSTLILGDSIFYFIIFFTVAAFTFLANLRFTFSYQYTRATALLDLLAFTLIASQFSILLAVFIFGLVYRLVSSVRYQAV